MTLAEIIYEKSQCLPENQARMVVEYIDSLLRNSAKTPSIDDCLAGLTPEQREAYEYLDKVRIDWGGKPITDREEANARR